MPLLRTTLGYDASMMLQTGDYRPSRLGVAKDPGHDRQRQTRQACWRVRVTPLAQLHLPADRPRRSDEVKKLVGQPQPGVTPLPVTSQSFVALAAKCRVSRRFSQRPGDISRRCSILEGTRLPTVAKNECRESAKGQTYREVGGQSHGSCARGARTARLSHRVPIEKPGLRSSRALAVSWEMKCPCWSSRI